MNRKLYHSILTLVLLAFTISAVQAKIDLGLAVFSNGNNIEGQTVPLSTKANITVSYDNTNGKSAAGILFVWYRNSPIGSWAPKEVLFVKVSMPSGFTKTVQYTFRLPGYYKFTWTVLRTVCESKTVCAKVGPVLPEPGTLAGLAISVAAVGLFFAKKRLTK